MGDYVQNATSHTHHQVQGDATRHVTDAAFTYHYGVANIGPVTLPTVDRGTCLALRAAAVTSQAALDAVIAGSPMAQAYASLIAAADAAQVPTLHHPRGGVRAWALTLLDLPAPPTN